MYSEYVLRLVYKATCLHSKVLKTLEISHSPPQRFDYIPE